MKAIAGLFMMGFGTAFAQGDIWNARETGELSLSVPGGSKRASLVTTMSTEKRCPPADSWTKPLPDESWNVVELGFAFDTPLQLPSETEPRLYSRYTCQRPIDRP